VKRAIIGCSFMLGLSVLAVGAPASGATAATKAQVHAQAARCDNAAKGHAKVTRGDIAACKESSYKPGGHCPKGSTVIIVKLGKQNYALGVGYKPKSLGAQYGMGTLNQACQLGRALRAAPIIVPPTTTSPPTTTTTQPPLPPTTTAPLPPPTTAAPASCTPMTDSGSCYEPGEYCRDSDHGASGVAGDGETITCENNNGWRWEPT
jgi:hypothetical protein